VLTVIFAMWCYDTELPVWWTSEMMGNIIMYQSMK